MNSKNQDDIALIARAKDCLINMQDCLKETDWKALGKQDLSIINACARKGYSVYRNLSWDKTTFTSKAAIATLTIAGATTIGLTALTAKTAFDIVDKFVIKGVVKGLKKTYRGAKGRANEIQEKMAEKNIALGKKVSKEAKEVFETSKNNAIDEVNKKVKSLDINTVENLKKIRGITKDGKVDLSNIDNFQFELAKKSDKEVYEMRQNLELIKTGKIREELLKVGSLMTPPLSNFEINEFLMNIGADDTGKLIFPEKSHSRISKKFIEKSMKVSPDIANAIYRYKKELPEISSLTDEEVEKIHNSVLIINGEVSFEFGNDLTTSEKNSEPYKSFINLFEDSDMYSQEVATKAKDIHELTYNHQTTSAVLKEVSETNKYYTAVSLENEFNVLDKLQRGLDIRETTNDNGLSETDRKIKKDVRKIASERVNAVSKLTGVDKSCLADFCKKDKAKQAQILSKAKSKLNPKLNKMRTRNIDKINNDIEKFNNPENDDKQNNQDFQFGY